jgi:RNA polymerase sigma-70 factor, ECF subfamily
MAEITGVALSASTATEVATSQSENPPIDGQRWGELVREHFAYVWRLTRRLGLREAEADDVSQQVFMVASRRLGDMLVGRERSFLYGTALRCVARWRRSEMRRREDLQPDLDESSTPWVDPEELLDRRRARELLDELLEKMTYDLRVVFVLFEIEHMTTEQIATMLDIPQGTAASRLRRAREEFSVRVARLQARRRFEGAES